MSTSATAELCKHDIDQMTCAICRKAAGLRPGIGNGQEADCTVRTFCALTGAEYDEAVEYLRAAGRRDGHGATREEMRDAFTAAGFTVTSSGLTLEAAARDGGDFYVSAARGRKGHAFAISAGNAYGAGKFILPGTRYMIFRVS